MDTSIFAGITVVVLQVASPSFGNNDKMPSKFTCDGDNIHPAISVKGVPKEAKSLAIILEAPDAMNGTVIHWAAWDIESAGDIAEKSAIGTQGKTATESMVIWDPARRKERIIIISKSTRLTGCLG